MDNGGRNRGGHTRKKSPQYLSTSQHRHSVSDPSLFECSRNNPLHEEPHRRSSAPGPPQEKVTTFPKSYDHYLNVKPKRKRTGETRFVIPKLKICDESLEKSCLRTPKRSSSSWGYQDGHLRNTSFRAPWRGSIPDIQSKKKSPTRKLGVSYKKSPKIEYEKSRKRKERISRNRRRALECQRSRAHNNKATDEQMSAMSQSVRIQRWLTGRGSQPYTSDSFATAEEGLVQDIEKESLENEERRLFGHKDLHNILASGRLHIKKIGHLAKKKTDRWLNRTDEVASDSESEDEEETADVILEESLIRDSYLQEILQRRISALRDKLVSKGQQLKILSLLDARQLNDALTLSREGHSRVRLDVCLLWACIQGDAGLIRIFLNEGANPEARDTEGFSALHLASESGSLEAVEEILNSGVRVNGPTSWDTHNEVTPLMLAARSGSPAVIKALILAGAEVDAGLHTRGESALHHAVRSRKFDCVETLLASGAKPNPLLLYSETPLHIAVIEDLSQIVDTLLKAGADVKASKGTSKVTALHLAAQECHCHIAHQLVKAGADPQQPNSRGQIPLHFAASAQCPEIVEILLGFGSDPNSKDIDGKTPLHSGIMKGSRCYECIQLLLDAGSDPNTADEAGYTPLHLAALQDSSNCVIMFLQHGGDVTAETKSGLSALSLILRRTPTVLARIHDHINSAISFSDCDHHHDRDSQVQLDFRVLLPGETPKCNKDEIQASKKPECRLLSSLIKEGQKVMLKHPLCETFLYLKWQKVRSFFVLNLIFYAILVLMLTAYIMLTFPGGSCSHLQSNVETVANPSIIFMPAPNAPLSNDKTNVESHEKILEKFSKLNFTSLRSKIKKFGHGLDQSALKTKYECNLLPRFPEARGVLLYTLWSFLGILAVKELFQIIDTPRTYLSSIDNVLVWPVIICTSVITVSSYMNATTQRWEHHIAAVVVLFSWVELLLLIGRFPLFGLYIQMFTQVTRNFGKFLFAYICLINAFSLSFGVLFPNHDPFKVFLLRLLKTLVMMTGEMEYDEWFFDREDILYPGTSHIIFALFLVFVTIILMNLLVGLAVSDIQGLQKSAGLDRLVRQVQQIAHFEAIMLSQWLSMLLPKTAIKVLRNKMMLFPSLYGGTLILTPKAISKIKLPKELIEALNRAARNRDHVARRRHAFANFQSLSNAAQYSADADGDVGRGIDAVRCGLDILMWEAEERRNESSHMSEAIESLTNLVEKVLQTLDRLPKEEDTKSIGSRNSCSSNCGSSKINFP